MTGALRGKALAVVCTAVVGSGGCGGEPQSGSATSPVPHPTSHDVLFNGSQPWTTDVSGAQPSDRSDVIVQTLSRMGGWGGDNALQIDFSIPVFFAGSQTPRMPVVGTDDYCWGGPACDGVPAEIPVPQGANIEGSSDLNCDASGDTDGQGDCHLLVADRENRRLYEIYQGSAEDEAITAQGLFVWDLDRQYGPTLRGDQCTSADAAGFPIAALMPTADEVASGAVNHALRFILPNDRMKASVYVRPATHAGGPESADPDAPPYGVRFRLKSDFDESDYSVGEKVILRALKTYGMLLSDGGEIPLTFADDRTSAAKWADLGIDAHSFGAVPVDQFEVVELGPDIPLTYDCVRNP